MSNSKSTGGGVGFCGLLAVAFIVLKLCKVIDWSWGWVFAPIWIPIGSIMAGTLICLVILCWTKRN